jgi:hypothetical protein
MSNTKIVYTNSTSSVQQIAKKMAEEFYKNFKSECLKTNFIKDLKELYLKKYGSVSSSQIPPDFSEVFRQMKFTLKFFKVLNGGFLIWVEEEKDALPNHTDL